MKQIVTLALIALGTASLAACAGKFDSLPTAASQDASPPGFGNLSVGALRVLEAPRYRACPDVPLPGHATCFAILGAIDARTVPDGLDQPGEYGPADLQGAYGLAAAAASGGKGVTVAAVDAWGYPDAKKDLAEYRAFWHQPACGSGCFRMVNQTGGSNLPKAGTGNNWSWQAEEALDVDMISAICPRCRILLVQADSDSSRDLFTAEQTALRKATIVSNSWGVAEWAATYPLFDSHPGKVITASAGDDGAGVPAGSGFAAADEMQPCGFTGVVCVGGTSLQVKDAKYKSETVWQDFHVTVGGKAQDFGATGSGCSRLVAKPSWQTDKGCKGRSAADIAVVGDPLTGVVIACTPCAQKYGFSGSLLGGAGGTSASSPIVAAVFALAGNAAHLASAPETIWKNAGKSTHDVVKGYNDKRGVSGLICTASISYICKARKGYDGPSGWGSPNGTGAF